MKDLNPVQSTNEAVALDIKLQAAFEAHCAGVGVPIVGGAFEAAILGQARSALSGRQTVEELIRSERLVTAMAASFNTIFAQLSEHQRVALRAGFDPLSANVIQTLNSAGGLTALLSGRQHNQFDGAGIERKSGQRFSELRSDDGRGEARVGFNDLNVDAATVSVFKSSGLSRSVFEDLIQRYKISQIRQAAGFANELGVTADTYVGKLVGLDTEGRSDLRDFVGEMRNDPAMSDDEKRKQIAEFRAAHPKLRGLSDSDMLNIVNAKHRDIRAKFGDDIKRGLSTGDLHAATDTRATVAANVEETTRARKSAKSASVADTSAIVDDAFGLSATGAAAPSSEKAKRKATGPAPNPAA